MTIYICYKFTPLYLRSLNVKFELNWLSDFLENYVVICWRDYNMSNLGMLTFGIYLQLLSH